MLGSLLLHAGGFDPFMGLDVVDGGLLERLLHLDLLACDIEWILNVGCHASDHHEDAPHL